MKTLQDYTIYCTKEQTKKALELDAPIERGHESSRYYNIGVPVFYDENDTICRVSNSVIFIPTAEQMIGWLGEKDIHFDFEYITMTCCMVQCDGKYLCNPITGSREEVTLKAIDAALDYLTQNKKKL